MMMRGPRLAFVLFITLLLVGCDADSNDDKTFDLIGKWAGIVTQSGGGYPTEIYPIIMEIDSLVTNQRAGSIDYPEFNCSGTLTFDRKSDDVYVLFEQIEVHQGNCALQGRIDIREKTAREISWQWHDIDGSGPFVTGVLNKK